MVRPQELSDKSSVYQVPRPQGLSSSASAESRLEDTGNFYFSGKELARALESATAITVGHLDLLLPRTSMVMTAVVGMIYSKVAVMVILLMAVVFIVAAFFQ